MNISHGSTWRRWDLHFHSPASHDYKDFSISSAAIIDHLVASDISVVAITDHHVMDINRIRELQQHGRSKGVTVLPGIEFLSSSVGSEPVHFIGIFSENCNLEYIWGQLKNKTNISQVEGDGRKHDQIYCGILDTSSLIRQLGGIVTIHAGTKSNTLETINSLPHGVAQKVDIAKAIDIFEIGKEKDFEDYNKHVIPFLKNKISRHIPMILCSDNHKASEYIVKQNLWIKADPTFEGLKQIIYEPEQRVRIQRDKPDFKEDKLIISEVSFTSSGKFTPNTIYLNDNLNVIIGGKSSGKSILLYHIAKTLVADQSFFENEGIADKYKFQKDDQAFNFTVRSKGGFSQNLHRDPTENSIIPEIKYIPQNYLVKLAEPEENKKGNALNTIVRDLINEDETSKQAYDDFLSKVRLLDKRRNTIISNYFDTQERIAELEKELKSKPSADMLVKNIATNEAKVEELNKQAGMTPEAIEKYNALQKTLENIKARRENASNDFRTLREFNSSTLTTLDDIRTQRSDIERDIATLGIKQLFQDTFGFLDVAYQKIKEFAECFEIVQQDEKSVFKVTSALSQIFSDLASERATIEKEISPYVQSDEIKKQIEAILKSITEDKAIILSIDNLKKLIASAKSTLKAHKDQLFELYSETYREYEQILAHLKPRTADLEKDGLKIDGLVRFNFAKFRKGLADISDGRAAHYGRYEICSDGYSAMTDFTLTELLRDLSQIFEDIVEKQDYSLTSKATRKMAIEFVFDDHFFDYWKIEYKNDKLGEMSTGKASFVILMLIIGLSTSKAPILIDQPEDNLDNRSITTDLVEYLRNKKIERQIILVTHNPNIVVNADAENIIIANQKGQNEIESSSPFVFDYINGSLENTFAKNDAEKDLLKSMGIREHIAEIVEGGKEAFKKREEKYGF